MGKYDDIINLKHHESETHPKMSMQARAAQFAPFAALSGFGYAIYKKGKTANYDPLTYEPIDQVD